MAKLYYWRHGRINPTHLFLVFNNQEHRNGISASIKPVPNDGWLYRVEKPFSVTEATEATREEAQAKAEQLINREFAPEYVPHFG